MSIKLIVAIVAIAALGYACNKVTASVEAIEYSVEQAVQVQEGDT